MTKVLPRITVVTPSYNQGKFIEETINSVINQNYPNLEYFVIDGGSTDDTLEIINKYKQKIDWWISEKDGGQSDAIQKGFDRGSGDLLGWLNSDDVYFPGALNSIAKAYIKNPTASIYMGGLAEGEINDGGIKKCSAPSRPLKMFNRLGLIAFGQQSTFFNARTLKEVGGLNKELYMRMDGDLIYRLLRANPSVEIVKKVKPLGFIRWHQACKSSNYEELRKKELAEFMKTIQVNKQKLITVTVMYKIYRLLTGVYLKSWLITQKYKGKRMKDVWHQ